jgi:transcription elongation GreA/GreB family factor
LTCTFNPIFKTKVVIKKSDSAMPDYARLLFVIYKGITYIRIVCDVFNIVCDFNWVLNHKRKNLQDMENYIDGLCNPVWRTRTITYTDYGRIVNHIDEDIGNEHFSPDSLHSLYLLATNSKKRDSQSFPDDIVTINSQVILAGANNSERLVRIVFPQDIVTSQDISVYSPLGIACLGARESTYVYVKHENSVEKFCIEKIIFQPERAGAFHL